MAELKSLRITSTGSLLPGNSAWRGLESIGTVRFSEFGAWSKDLVEIAKDEILFLHIHLQDLMENSSFEDADVLIQRLEPLIRQRLKACSQPLIVMISSQENKSVIDSVRDGAIWRRAKYRIFQVLDVVAAENENLYVWEFESFISNFNGGIFDSRNWYFARCRFSLKGIQEIAKSLQAVLERIYRPAAKVLVLDCDNTLWGGVAGEDGIQNILLGQDGIGDAFCDFQREIKKRADQGLVLAISSKNDQQTVFNIFENHSAMLLKANDITVFKVNWDEKYKNIKEISSELGLGLDSFVFWDDNPLERDKVSRFLPEVLVVDPPIQVTEWPEKLRCLDAVSKLSLSDADVKKTEQYRNRAAFVNDAASAPDIFSYLKSIDLRPRIHNLDDGNIGRAVQLTQKTNQFNLRTVRYSSNELLSLDYLPDSCFLVGLADCYGDHGLIGVVVLRFTDSSSAFIDTFALSCRVLGRFLETWVLAEIAEICKDKKVELLVGEYIPSGKNSMVKNFYLDHGFRKVSTECSSDLGFPIDAEGDVYACRVSDIDFSRLEIFGGK